MNDEFAARKVAREVIEHLERRRTEIVGDDGAVRNEVERALESLREAYRESALPPAYFAALEQEIGDVMPGRWREVAAPFTAVERKAFGSWRGGDVYARVLYVFLGLLIGGLCVKLPFIPIWEKWFPFALAGGAWWLPDAQAAWHRRQYARRLGAIVSAVGSRQKALEAKVSLAELLPDDGAPRGGGPSR